MPNPILTGLFDSSRVPDQARLEFNSGGNLAVGKPTGAFGRLWQGLSRIFSSDVRERNRQVIGAYLDQLRLESPELAEAARAELGGRIASGKQISVRAIRQLGAGTLVSKASAQADALIATGSTDEEALRKAARSLELGLLHLSPERHPGEALQLQSRADKIARLLEKPGDALRHATYDRACILYEEVRASDKGRSTLPPEQQAAKRQELADVTTRADSALGEAITRFLDLFEDSDPEELIATLNAVHGDPAAIFNALTPRNREIFREYLEGFRGIYQGAEIVSACKGGKEAGGPGVFSAYAEKIAHVLSTSLSEGREAAATRIFNLSESIGNIVDVPDVLTGRQLPPDSSVSRQDFQAATRILQSLVGGEVGGAIGSRISIVIRDLAREAGEKHQPGTITPYA